MNQEQRSTLQQPDETAEPSRSALRAYPAPWKGQLVLACRKCQKKLRARDGSGSVAKLKKALKSCAKHDQDSIRIRLVEVSCLKLCPKGAVAVCTQSQLGAGTCSMVRSGDDVEALYTQCKAEAARQSLNAAPAL